MSDSDSVDIKIGKDLVAPILDKKIQMAIVESIGDPHKFVCEAVNAVLRTKVNADGKRDSYSHNNEYDLIDVLSRQAISEAVRSALTELLAEKKPMIKDAIKAQIAKRPNALAKALVDGMTGAFSDTYRLRIDVTVPQE